jgi:hypothetical protein
MGFLNQEKGTALGMAEPASCRTKAQFCCYIKFVCKIGSRSVAAR